MPGKITTTVFYFFIGKEKTFYVKEREITFFQYKAHKNNFYVNFFNRNKNKNSFKKIFKSILKIPYFVTETSIGSLFLKIMFLSIFFNVFPLLTIFSAIFLSHFIFFL